MSEAVKFSLQTRLHEQQQKQAQCHKYLVSCSLFYCNTMSRSNNTPAFWLPQMQALVHIAVEYLEDAGISVHDFYESCFHTGTNNLIFSTGVIRNKANRVRQVARTAKTRSNWNPPTFSQDLYNWLKPNEIIDRLYAVANNLPLPQAANNKAMQNNNNNNDNGGEDDVVKDIATRMRNSKITGSGGTEGSDEEIWQKGPLPRIILDNGPSTLIRGLTTVVTAKRITDDGTGKKGVFTIYMDMPNWEDRDKVSTNDEYNCPSLHACLTLISFLYLVFVQFQLRLCPTKGWVSLGKDEHGTPLIGTTVLSLSYPTTSTSLGRHMESLFQSVEEEHIDYYSGNAELVKSNGIEISGCPGTWLPVPNKKLDQDLLSRKDSYTDAIVTMQGGKEDGELAVQETDCKLFKLNGRQLSVSNDQWQGGHQNSHLSQSSMIATPTFLYSIAEEERPAPAPRELSTRFKVMWELPLTDRTLSTGLSGTTPPRVSSSSYARRLAALQQGRN